jgi:hypothetical protein
MEDYMPGSDEVKHQLQQDIIDKATENLKDKVEQFTGITL